MTGDMSLALAPLVVTAFAACLVLLAGVFMGTRFRPALTWRLRLTSVRAILCPSTGGTMIDSSSRLGVVLLVLAMMVLAGCHDGSPAGGVGGTTGSTGGAGGSGVGDSGAGGVRIITGVSPATIASFEGTYALESFTVNPTACDVEGPSETSAHKLTFVMAGGPSVRPALLGLFACNDAIECAEKVAAVRAGTPVSAEYGLFLTEEISVNLLRDGSEYPGYYVDGLCTNRKWYPSELTRAGDSVRVETRTVPLADAASATKTCESGSPAQLDQEAQGRACSALRVISGTKTGPLP